MKILIRGLISVLVISLLSVFTVSAQTVTEDKPVVKEKKAGKASYSDDYKHAHFKRGAKDKKRIKVQATDSVAVNHNYKQQAGGQKKTKRNAIVIKEEKGAVDDRNYKHQVPLKRK